MKNLMTVVFVLFTLTMLSQSQNPIAKDVVRYKAFWPDNPCGNHIGEISRELITKNITEDGIYTVSIRGRAYSVNVDYVSFNETTHILFAATQCKKINYTVDSKNYLDAVGGIIWNFVNDSSKSWFGHCSNLIEKIVRFNTTIVTPGPGPGTVVPNNCNNVVKTYANYLGAYATNDISYEMLLAKYEQIALTQCGSSISFPKRTSTGTIDPPVDYCNKEEGQNKIYEILYTYENFDIFTGKNNAQAKVDAVLRQYSCLAYEKVQRANKLWKKGKPFFIAGAALTAGYLIYKNNRKSNNKEVSWGGNTTSFGKTKFGGNNTF
jgi:hypothetical protein